MATAKFIREALESLTDAVLEVHTLTAVAIDLAGDEPDAPQWPWLVSRQVERLEAASQELEMLLRQKALPLLEDFDRTRS